MIRLLLPALLLAHPVDLSFLYDSLDPLSVTESFTFYELYPESPEGKKALERGWRLLCGEEDLAASFVSLPSIDLQSIVSLTTKQPSAPPVILGEKELSIINGIAKKLSNRKLKGSAVWTEQELLALPEEEIDLSRALLIYQFQEDPKSREKIIQYEALLDLMALQIRARVQEKDPLALIEQISTFIFYDMGFRFPPFSVHRKDIDLYTFLPSVLDSRHGVCLGVSILYLSLAQRLGLELEVITPPGHIYVRYPLKEGELNIETTARGIHIPSSHYLGVNTRKLEKRKLKEVVGMAFMNHAALLFGKGEYKEAVKLYERAALYIKEDPLLQMFHGINCLLSGQESKGRKILRPLCPLTLDYAVSEETIPADYIKGAVDAEGLKAIFAPVDETKTSIIEKQEKLLKTVAKYPHFREGLLQLAVAYLQLDNTKEALNTLTKYIALDPNDITVHYYAAILSFERLDYVASWSHLKKAQALAKERDYSPKALEELHLALRRVCPNPSP